MAVLAPGSAGNPLSRSLEPAITGVTGSFGTQTLTGFLLNSFSEPLFVLAMGEPAPDMPCCFERDC